MQTSVNNVPLQAYDGKLHERAIECLSGVCDGVVPFGKALTRSATVGIGEVNPTVRTYTSGEIFAGIAVADPTLETIAGATAGQYSDESSVMRLTKGKIWVKTADAVDSLAKSVFVKSSEPSGTAASVTDNDTWPVADQDTLTLVVSITGHANQTVLFAGATTTAAAALPQINAQLDYCSAAIVGGHLVITTDETGAGITIAIAVTGTSTITWGTPVAGTGDAATSLGSFRATTTTGYTDLGALVDVEWVAGATIGGSYFGLLKINV